MLGPSFWPRLAERRGRAPRSSNRGPARSPRLSPRNQLPVMLTTFVGRERELAEFLRLMGACRLLTLTGAGGVGKTRLAVEAARTLNATAAADIGWIDLGALAEPKLVPQAIAFALGVPEQYGRPILDILADALALRQLLIVLDNCEHLVPACAAVADRLLRNCPDLRIVATSRQPLGVAGETAWRVPSLAEPEARRLFVDRALAAEPDLVLSDHSASAITEVCQRLDGIPLAIEFAAARVSVLAPEQIAARLADRLSLLTVGSRTAPPDSRHSERRSTGATACWGQLREYCSSGWQCSPAAGVSKQPKWFAQARASRPRTSWIS